MAMIISVIVPTYRRPKDLARCLEGLSLQSRLANEVFAVVRNTDSETWSFFNSFNLNLPNLHLLTVEIAGVVAAMNVGLDAAKGDIVAFIDDDAVPHANWLFCMEAHFQEDSKLGGVGGRDFIYENGILKTGSSEVVGQLQWFGRMIGNHDTGIGSPREVDILKGVNMGFRRVAVGDLRFDKRLLGSGAQVHLEVAFCLSLKRSGWKIIYDPVLMVDHFRAQRFDEDQRDTFNHIALINSTHNYTLALLDHFSPFRRFVFLVWVLLVGTREHLGFVQLFRFLPTQGNLSVKKWLASIEGTRLGYLTWSRNKIQP